MSANNRKARRQPVTVHGMIYDQQGKQLASCVLRNVSASGAQVELKQEAEIPETFVLSLSHDGHVRRACSKVWQTATAVGVRFAERPSL